MNQKRTVRFVARIEQERRALRVANAVVDSGPELGALTEPAIRFWSARQTGRFPSAKTIAFERFRDCLLEIGKRLEIEADASRDAFEITNPSDGSIGSLIDDLGAVAAMLR